MLCLLDAEDLPLVALLAKESGFGRTYTLSKLEAYRRKPNTLIVGAKPSSDLLIGFALFEVVEPEAELHLLVVDSSYRRRGWAQRILSFAESLVREKGCSVVFLEVAAETNPTAYSLYIRCGYEAVARRARYYANGDDAVVMKRKVSP